MVLTQEELDKIVESHGKWLRGEEGGERANLRGMDLSGANLSGACLRVADLYKADLSGADLCRADLRGAFLYKADLCRADLREADLREADLSGADLRGAFLCRADLSGAFLYEADLFRANLSRSDLCMADLDEKIIQVGPIGSRRDYTVYNATRDVVQCGCWRGYKGGTLDEFAKRVEEVYPVPNKYGDEYRRLIAYLRTVREVEVRRND